MPDPGWSRVGIGRSKPDKGERRQTLASSPPLTGYPDQAGINPACSGRYPQTQQRDYSEQPCQLAAG